MRLLSDVESRYIPDSLNLCYISVNTSGHIKIVSGEIFDRTVTTDPDKPLICRSPTCSRPTRILSLAEKNCFPYTELC